MKTIDGVNLDNLNKAYENGKITLPRIRESKNYFFFTYYYGNIPCYTVFKKDREEFIFQHKVTKGNFEKGKEKVNFGFKNDLVKDAPAF
jgi:hypothetical protein